ncbi:MAG: hypothetical protein ACYCWW_14595 [Deltaproteobacteria bacterium]
MTDPTKPSDALRWERIVGRATELIAEALREGGVLVIVFGLLDYYLGEGRPRPWQTGVFGSMLLFGGIAMDVTRREWIKDFSR